MPKLSCSYRDARAAADKKLSFHGHTGEDQYRIIIDGKKYGKVTVPVAHGPSSAPIPEGTLKSMVYQLKLDRDTEFPDWRDCPMSREDYEQIIKERFPGA